MLSDMGDKEPDDKDAAEDGARPVEAVQDADCNGHALAELAAPEQSAEPEVLISPFFQLDAAHIGSIGQCSPMSPTDCLAFGPQLAS